MFSSRILMDSYLTLRSFIHFEFIFVYGVREWLSFILLHIAVPARFIEETVFFPLDIFPCFVEDYLPIELRVHIWALYSVPLVYVSVFMPVPCCIGDHSFLVNLEIR